MPRRLFHRLAPLAAACLLCLGCGADPPPGQGTAAAPGPTTGDVDQGAKPGATTPTEEPPVRTDVPPAASTGDGDQGAKPAEPTPTEQAKPTEADAEGSGEPPMPEQSGGETDGETDGEKEETAEQQTIPIADNWVRLSQEHEIWIDMKAKQVMVAGQICLDRGGLEVFACPRQTKDHESVVSVNALALELHTCLIAIGADPGKPVQWTPEYQQATGPKIKIEVRWSKEGQEVTRNAKELVRNFETKKELERDWVFCGSQFYTNPEDGSKIYYGDSGEMICLSNFSTATLDLPIESSGSNESLLFEVNPDKTPPLGTKVYLVLSVLKPGHPE